jgi:hypothetical protein
MPFDRRGIVLAPSDLDGLTERWLDWMSEGRLNVLGLHSGVEGLVEFVDSPEGSRCLASARSRGIAVEFEIHALGQLLPGSLFAARPDWFRANDDGDRVADANFCVSNDEALGYVAEQAVAVAKRLPSETNLYYLWADDAQPWCRCDMCRELSPSDQNLIAMNAMANALHGYDHNARLAYLAYWNTLTPPTVVRPSAHIFLEYAPIKRNSAKSLDDPDDAANAEHADNLRRLVKAFDMTDAKVLEYWMDASRYSNWRRPSVKIPFDGDVWRRDATFYASLGFRSATSFGVFIDAEYVERFGTPPVTEYGRMLAEA